MRSKRHSLTALIAGLAMLMLILDGKTAIHSAREGVELCLRTVVPSLFPFFVLSGIISSYFTGQKIPLLKPLCRFCRIPAGSESLLLIGLIGGYPVGAQLITQAVTSGNLSYKDGVRMLGFCSNAGPAFLFGMLSPLFAEKWLLWLLWGVQIGSALLTGFLLPGGTVLGAKIQKSKQLTFTEALQAAIRVMASVCGWVILFRIVIGFGDYWLLCYLPGAVKIALSGLLELSNGCVLLAEIPNSNMRFLLAGVFLSFGGICVAMQTQSVTKVTGIGWYFPGKVIQSLLALFLCLCICSVLGASYRLYLLVAGIATSAIIFLIRRKLGMEYKKTLVYNEENQLTKEIVYAIS